MHSNLHGLPLKDAAGGTTFHVITDSVTRCLTGPTPDVKSTASSLSVSTTILSSKEFTVDCNAVKRAYYTGGFACTNSESTSDWHANLDGLPLHDAAGGNHVPRHRWFWNQEGSSVFALRSLHT